MAILEAELDGAVERFHATAIAVGTRTVLIRGPSGSGKSDLALRCLSLSPSQLIPHPVRLIADDQVVLTRNQLNLSATAPATIIGKLEIRGLGIVNLDPVHNGNVVLIADLVERSDFVRLPDPWPVAKILGLAVPLLRICSDEASAHIKVAAAVNMPGLPSL